MEGLCVKIQGRPGTGDITMLVCYRPPDRITESQNHRITESQNHRMFGVGRDLCESSSPTLLPKQGHLQQAAQELRPGGSWISPERENPQPLWAACSRAPSLSLNAAHGRTLCASFSVRVPVRCQEDAHLTLLPLTHSRSLYPRSGLGCKAIDTFMKTTCDS